MPADLRALTCHRVWAGMVAHGWKPWEFRNARPTAIIGQRVAIHAGMKLGDTPAALAVLRRTLTELPPGVDWVAPDCGFSALCHLSDAAPGAAPAGHIVALATIGEPIDLSKPGAPRWWMDPTEKAAQLGRVAARTHLPPGYELVRWAIPLLAVRRLPEPIPCRGSVTLGWRVPADVAARVLAQDRAA